MSLLRIWLNDLQETWDCLSRLKQQRDLACPSSGSVSSADAVSATFSQLLHRSCADSSITFAKYLLSLHLQPLILAEQPGLCCPHCPSSPSLLPERGLSRISPSSECFQHHSSRLLHPTVLCPTHSPEAAHTCSPCSRGNGFPLALGLSHSAAP